MFATHKGWAVQPQLDPRFYIQVACSKRDTLKYTTGNRSIYYPASAYVDEKTPLRFSPATDFEIKRSGISGAGNGLFARQNLPQNTLVLYSNEATKCFTGKNTYDRARQGLTNVYGVTYLHMPSSQRLSSDCHTPPQPGTRPVGCAANSTKDPEQVNAMFTAVKLVGEPGPQIALVTTRKVRKGDEIIIDYGGLGGGGDYGTGIDDDVYSGSKVSKEHMAEVLSGIRRQQPPTKQTKLPAATRLDPTLIRSNKVVVEKENTVHAFAD